MGKLSSIECDLGDYKITLRFSGKKEPLIVHFNTPSRRFHFSIIVLTILEIKKAGKPSFLYIRKYQKVLEQLDKGLSEKHTSKDAESMWAKINMAWRHRLPDLEAAALFKLPGRDQVPPFEKGGKYRYECSDVECDTWANLFSYDETNKWRIKFAIESASIKLDDIDVSFGNLKDNAAWNEFLNRLSIQPEIENNEKKTVSALWKKLAFSLIAALIIGASAWVTWNHFSQPSQPEMSLELPVKPSIAVLPFKNLSDEPQQDYLADGIVEGIITALANVPKVFVIASNSTFTYRGKSVKVQQVSQELGVRYVVEGSFLKAGDKVRITAQLIDAVSGHHLWAQRYDRYLNDILAVQDKIIKNIITAMQVELTEGEQAQATAKGTNNLEAYLLVLRAIDYNQRANTENNAMARKLAKESIALDPEYAVAYKVLARAHLYDFWIEPNIPQEQILAEATGLLEKAINLDSNYAEAYSLLAYVYMWKRENQKALKLANKAVSLNPNSAETHFRLGKMHTFANNIEESILEYRYAIRLNPFPPGIYLWSLGLSYSALHQYDEAIRWCEKAIQIEPDNLMARIITTVVYSRAGHDEKAQITAKEVLRINPKFSLDRLAKRAHPNFIEALRKSGLK